MKAQQQTKRKHPQSDAWFERAKKVVDDYPRFLEEFETLLSGNEILMARTQGVGVLARPFQGSRLVHGHLRAARLGLHRSTDTR